MCVMTSRLDLLLQISIGFDKSNSGRYTQPNCNLGQIFTTQKVR